MRARYAHTHCMIQHNRKVSNDISHWFRLIRSPEGSINKLFLAK